MFKKSFIVLILIGILISGCSELPLESVGKQLKLSQNSSDCEEDQYYDATERKCKKIINECYTGDDCPRDETCVRKEISTSLACIVGEECPRWYRNVCELTEETKKYCEQDSDCVLAFISNTCCDCPQIYNKKYVDSDDELRIYEKGKDYTSFRTVDCSKILCKPCAEITELECVNNQCQKLVGKANNSQYKQEDIPVKSIPTSKAPYNKEELKRITTVKTKIADISEEAIDDIIGKIQPRVRTFTGQKYKVFDPELALVGGSPRTWRFLFSGRGHIDESSYDLYYIRVSWDGEAHITEEAIAWMGVPIEYEEMGENISRQEKELMEKTPYLDGVRWLPEEQGRVRLYYSDTPPAPGIGTIPEHSMTFIVVDLKSNKISSVEKRFWDPGS